VSSAAVVVTLALGLDVFVGGLGLGLAGVPRARWAGVALFFAGAAGLMALAGVLLGRRLGAALGDPAVYLAGVLLLGLAGRSLRKGWPSRAGAEAEAAPGAAPPPPGAARVAVTGLVVTLDKLAVGLALGAAGRAAGPLLVLLVVVCLLATGAGLAVGARVGGRLGGAAELLAGGAFGALGVALIVGALRS
jgi:putative Mn2+ efflux pump MntP